MSDEKKTFEQWKAELGVAADELAVEEVFWAQIAEEDMRAAWGRGELPAYFLGREVARLGRPGR